MISAPLKSSLSPLLAAPEHRRAHMQTNMGRVQLHAQSAGLGLAHRSSWEGASFSPANQD